MPRPRRRRNDPRRPTARRAEERGPPVNTRLRHLAIALAASALAAIPSPGATETAGYLVIVNAANPVSSLPKREASDLFLKRTAKWPNGERVRPVDLAVGSSVREAFSRAVHGRRAADIDSHWQSLIFAGRDVPPSIKASEADVLDYVRRQAGGIGYVSAELPLGEGVKPLTVEP